MNSSVSVGSILGAQDFSRPPQASFVLLAVADPKQQAELLALLESWGHLCEVTPDGNALIRALHRSDGASVIVLDADLPGLRGMALLNQLQLRAARRSSWTVLLRTAVPAAGLGRPRYDAGFDDVLSKPVDEYELRISLRAASSIQARAVEMAEAVEAARFDAGHDSLTGLLNREALLKVLFQETDRVQRLGSRLSFLLLDLDQFSRINREYGYDGGDRVLRQLASRFRRFLRSYDIAGRCGADQFLIAMPGCTQEDARSMAARLRDCVSERPFDILQATVTMTASIGISQSGGRSPLAVLREAEHALSRAKLAGGACARWYSGSNSRAEQVSPPVASVQEPPVASFQGRVSADSVPV